MFLGIHMPQIVDPNWHSYYTTAHLERAPGWITVFRNVNAAVYLRANERNRANLERVIDYYARRGVPFDAERGLSPAAVIRDPAWAQRHGMVPVGFGKLAVAAGKLDPCVSES